jgi:carbon storage regulator
MLVLTRKMSQVIKLGDDITITVVRTSQGSVKLGIEAPSTIRITRESADCSARSLGIQAR